MKTVWITVVFVISLVLTGCQGDEDYPMFEGTVIEVGQTYVIVEPIEGEEIRQSGSKVSITVDEDVQLEVGDAVRVIHEGPIMESFPLQINLIEIEQTD